MCILPHDFFGIQTSASIGLYAIFPARPIGIYKMLSKTEFYLFYCILSQAMLGYSHENNRTYF